MNTIYNLYSHIKDANNVIKKDCFFVYAMAKLFIGFLHCFREMNDFNSKK